MSWGNLGVARIRDTARESQLGINRVIIRGLRIAVRTMGGCARAPTQICTARQRERGRGRGLIDMQTRARTRAYVQKCIRTPPLSRVRERFRAYGRCSPLLPLSLFCSIAEIYEVSEFEAETVFSRSTRRALTADFTFPPRRALLFVVGILVENRGIEFFLENFLDFSFD